MAAAEQQDVRTAVLEVLPDLPTEKVSALMEGLEGLGVESKEDISLLTEDNLLPFLRVVQCRKFLRAFSSKAISPPGPPQPSSTLSLVGSPARSPQLSIPETPCRSNPKTLPSPRTSWPKNFKVNWLTMPTEIQSAIAASTRPSPAARRAMIRELVDQMRAYNVNPNRGICVGVVNDIIHQYPACFADVNDNMTVAGASLVQQVKNRIEHVNRNITLARLRKTKQSSPHSQAGANARGSVDKYGCVQWAPEKLPSGETEQSLQQMKSEMQQLYAQEGMAGVERGALQTWLKKTYILQRRDLNFEPPHTILKLKEDWPFLFSLHGLFQHFEELTAVPIREKMAATINDKQRNMLEYFATQKTANVDNALQKHRSKESVCLVMCLLAYFREADDGIFLSVDPTATAADIQTSSILPCTPRLIIPGDILQADTWYMSIEGVCVMGPHSNILHGLTAVFAAYFVFNLQYPAESAATLEFIQRAFCGIHAQTGSKTGERRGLNAPVCTLLRKLLDFELKGSP